MLWWAVQALQWLVGAVVQLAFAAALVAVARQERTVPVSGEEE